MWCKAMTCARFLLRARDRSQGNPPSRSARDSTLGVAVPRHRTPLREQAFRIGILAIGPIFALVGLTCVAAAGVFGSLPPGVLVITLGALLLLAVIALVAGVALGDRLVGDDIEVAYREPGKKWHHGRVDVTPGRMSLRKYRWQVRIPTGAPIIFDIIDVGSEERRPKAAQWWSLNPQLRIVDVQTEQGPLELGAAPSHLKELRQRLAP